MTALIWLACGVTFGLITLWKATDEVTHRPHVWMFGILLGPISLTLFIVMVAQKVLRRLL